MRLPLCVPFVLLLGGAILGPRSWAAEPVRIESRLEPLVDDALFEQLAGDAALRLHKPTPAEVALVTDRPWEGNTCAYYTIFQDGDRYRMYYRGSHWDEAKNRASHREVACYAESRDGVHWTRPELGLFEFEGSKQNNIVWDGYGSHNFTPFRDPRPDCPPESLYKAVAGDAKGGLKAFQSPDGIHWKYIQEAPILTDGAFDSQNLAFWDPAAKLYRAFYRKGREGRRDILGVTSEDFLHWTSSDFLDYGDAPREHLYTNAVRCYPGAPHILIGFPTRYHPDRNSQVEPTFMTSRDGRHFHRWTEALIPVTAPENRDGNRSNYMTWGVLDLPDDSQHVSVYATEAYYTGPDSRVRRFVYRKDGFVSLHADHGGLVTKPLAFAGDTLWVNFATGDGGSLRFGLEGADGAALAGFGLGDCEPLRGDSIRQAVRWSGGSLGAHAGKPVRLRVELERGDLFSLQFGAAR